MNNYFSIIGDRVCRKNIIFADHYLMENTILCLNNPVINLRNINIIQPQIQTQRLSCLIKYHKLVQSLNPIYIAFASFSNLIKLVIYYHPTTACNKLSIRDCYCLTRIIINRVIFRKNNFIVFYMKNASFFDMKIISFSANINMI